MKLTIFGAAGSTGKHLVRKALERGYEVVAYARTPAKLNIQHANLTIIQGDIREADKVSGAIKEADGVINVIGPTPGSPDYLMHQAAENIVTAMKAHEVQRLIWSTGAGVHAPQDEPTLMHKMINFLLKLLSPKVLENALKGAEVVKASGLDWTIARAPMLTDKPGNTNFHVSYVGPEMGRTLSRENFAEFMLEIVETNDWVQKMPAISDK